MAQGSSSSASRYERLLASANRYLEKNNLEDAERTFSSAVREVYLLRNKIYETAIALKGLGLVYKARGKIHKSGEDLVKASGLLTASLNRLRECPSKNESKRTVKVDLTPEIRSVEEEIRNVHTMFIDEILQSQQNDSKSDFRKRKHYKQTLQTIRDSCQSKISAFDKMAKLDPDARDIRVESERIEQTQQLYKFISKSMKDLITSMANDCIKVMSSPPCKFSILGLGSTAREEATPYSDLEFCILVEKNTDSVMQYFTDFTNLLHLKVVELGETILPSLGIKSLNDYYSRNKGVNWFYDDGPRGFSFDGAMPWASKTPKGRNKTLKKPWVQSLIKTPRDMVGLLSEESIFKEGYHLADVLSTPSLICGDDSLFKDYSKLMGEHFEKTLNNCNSAKVDFKFTYQINPMSWKERILHGLVEVNTKYRNLLGDFVSKPGESYQVKTDIYRFPSLVIQYVGKYFDVQCPSSWETIGKLVSAEFLTEEGAHDLKTALGIAAELRLRTYLSNQGQSEYFKTNLQYLCLLQRFFFTVIPLKEALEKLNEGSGLPEVMKSEFYQNNSTIKANTYLTFREYEKGREILKDMLGSPHDSLPNAEVKITVIGNTLLIQGKPAEAEKYFRIALEIVKRKYDRDPQSRIYRYQLGGCYMNYSTVLLELGKIEEAISYGKKALENRYSLYKDSSTAPAWAQINLLSDIASIHYNLGKIMGSSLAPSLDFGDEKHNEVKPIFLLEHGQKAIDIAYILYEKYNTPFPFHASAIMLLIEYQLRTMSLEMHLEKNEELLHDALKMLYRTRKYAIFTREEEGILFFLGMHAMLKFDWKNARFAFNRVYDIQYHIHGGKDDDSLVKLLNNIALVSENEGNEHEASHEYESAHEKYKESTEFYTQALDMCKRIHGDDKNNELLQKCAEGFLTANAKSLVYDFVKFYMAFYPQRVQVKA